MKTLMLFISISCCTSFAQSQSADPATPPQASPAVQSTVPPPPASEVQATPGVQTTPATQVAPTQQTQAPQQTPPAQVVPAAQPAPQPVQPNQVPAIAQPMAVQPQAPPAQPVAPPKIEDPDKRWRFAIGLGYMLSAGKGSFKDGNYTSGTDSVSGSAELEYEKANSIILEGRFQPKNAWGFLVGINIEGERKFKKGKLSGGGETIELQRGTGEPSKIQFTTVYFSAAYRWETLYIPLGLNLSAVEFTPAAGYTGTHSESGGIGAQLGIGVLIKDQFALELYSWATSMSLKSSDSTGTVDFGEGYFGSTLLVGKFAF